MFDERVQLYDFKVDPADTNTPQAKFISMIGRGKRVLEVGCANGTLSAFLTQRMGCEVVGIELNPEAARIAEKNCSQIIVGDVENGAFEQVSGLFDVIAFGDVLEHLVTPGAVLARSKDYLAANGYILISVPNVAHYSVRIDLLLGKFDYQDYGFLDRTHLRFFTLKTARQMIQEAGLVIQDSDIVYLIRGMRFFRPWKQFEQLLKKNFPGLVGRQFIFKAAKHDYKDDGTMAVTCGREHDRLLPA